MFFGFVAVTLGITYWAVLAILVNATRHDRGVIPQNEQGTA
jgi:hypothetical protein